jgi:hypothetical protein
MARRIFLLSPASTKGVRASLLLGPRASSPLAQELRSSEGVSLGEVYSFLSSLYFRGKAVYSERFGSPPAGVPSAFVITPGIGLRPLAERVTLEDLRSIAKVEVHAKNPRHTDVLARDAAALLRLTGDSSEYVLLGSIATSKYVRPLLSVFGYLLMFPVEFIGRGDMSRGGLLLRAAREGRELEYARVATSLGR